MVAETLINRGSACVEWAALDGLCCDGGVGLGSVAVSDGQCLMVAETLGRCMTVLLSSLMEGIYYCFILLLDI